MTAAEAKHWFLFIRNLPVDANTGSYYAQLGALRALNANSGAQPYAVRQQARQAVAPLVVNGHNAMACMVAGADAVTTASSGQTGLYTAEFASLLALPANAQAAKAG